MHTCMACKYRFEVGVRVEGYAVGGEERHINSAFFIFRATEEGLVLPKLVPDGQVRLKNYYCHVSALESCLAGL